MITWIIDDYIDESNTIEIMKARHWSVLEVIKTWAISEGLHSYSSEIKKYISSLTETKKEQLIVYLRKIFDHQITLRNTKNISTFIKERYDEWVLSADIICIDTNALENPVCWNIWRRLMWYANLIDSAEDIKKDYNNWEISLIPTLKNKILLYISWIKWMISCFREIKKKSWVWIIKQLYTHAKSSWRNILLYR